MLFPVNIAAIDIMTGNSTRSFDYSAIQQTYTSDGKG